VKNRDSHYLTMVILLVSQEERGNRGRTGKMKCMYKPVSNLRGPLFKQKSAAYLLKSPTGSSSGFVTGNNPMY